MGVPTRPAISPVWLVLTSIVSVQVGAALAKGVFTQTSPVAMTWLRNTGAALILLTATAVLRRVRPAVSSPVGARRRWTLGLGYAAALLGMNWAIYESFHRIPIGVAVTVEFLGPLTVALLGSRRPGDLVWVGLAATGVALLGFNPSGIDLTGVAFALVAATCWAAYILLSARMRGVWQGLDLLTMTCTLGAVVMAAPAILTGGPALLTPVVLATGLGVALLSSVIPYSLELRALRSMPPRVFGILMSLEPAAAALAALVVLGELLQPTDWVAIGCVVVASAGATGRRPGPAAG